MNSKIIIRVALITAAILMIPFVAMRFTNEVNWDETDFIVMGTMIFVTGLMLNLIMRKAGKYRIYAALVIVFLFLWLWVELAVGLFTQWGS
jgi:hypothetical protein